MWINYLGEGGFEKTRFKVFGVWLRPLDAAPRPLGTTKLFSVPLSNFGIIFSDSIATDWSKKIDFLKVPGRVPLKSQEINRNEMTKSRAPDALKFASEANCAKRAIRMCPAPLKISEDVFMLFWPQCYDQNLIHLGYSFVTSQIR